MKIKAQNLVLVTLFFAASCSDTTQSNFPVVTPQVNTPVSSTFVTALPTSPPPTLWISASVPEALREALAGRGIPVAETKEAADLWLDVHQPPDTENPKSVWIYALAAPFPTVSDGVTLDDLLASWGGSASGVFAESPLLMTESTLEAFKAIWGEPAPEFVKSVPSDQLLDQAWNTNPSWAILPFDELEPRWKVLTIDGQSPIRKNFDPAAYPLQVTFSIASSHPENQQIADIDLPTSNREASKLTTIILTGVTALVRGTAYTMEQKGVTYPGRDIRDTLHEADIAHISNEVPFFSGCPSPVFEAKIIKMCSSPRYIELLTDIGADVVELTGDHFADYEATGMFETLEIYKKSGIPYYGGGADLNDSLKPALFEHNGNKIAFIGCNRQQTGKYPTATDQRPGAAPCDFDILTQKVSELDAQGYVVIFTFQWFESGDMDAVPDPLQQEGFRLVADAGASIVSGSQAHYAQAMEFYNGSFIHYGLGNMFFDQMGEYLENVYPGIRRLFHDRYVIYDGRHLGTELLTSMLEDYSRPRPMTTEERANFLQEYFNISGWSSPAQTAP